ncbi:flagellar biosynthesis anti-sigma factor FlgM [Conexibacter sp. CPCC 206217]|uniref:flagellar biosynthesis anti-sigma factor FlgM n=1 Tax=Conexibacter sp. CPCC 206217 TaxID=3064574 RepID=UPI002721C316|nr:flagellar biosynthesis anti-sigma factor FlgM [Conexibacter sp. CPCC 206217]MDO8211507.1 flagellar biosynthesis anti-sigma factor FlgM [Conexibacter sp. CPCC 206217]
MDETRAMKIDELRNRIARADYDVDVDAVAEAFVVRMLAVHGALRRADVRALLGDAYDEIGGVPSRKSCS